jgi:shikimate dehydrogenase
MVYRPAETPLLHAARLAGCKTVNGLGMLLHQGAKAFEIWTGRAAPLEVMRRALEDNVYGPAKS